MIRRQILARNPTRRYPTHRNPATTATNPSKTTTSSQGSNRSSVNGRVLENDGAKQGGVGAGAPAADEADREALCPAAEKLSCAVEAVLSREASSFPSEIQAAPADDGGLTRPVVAGWSTTGEKLRGQDAASAVVVNNEQNVRGKFRSSSNNNSGRGEGESESDGTTDGLLQNGPLQLPREDGTMLKIGVKGTENGLAATAAVKGGEDAGGAGMKYRNILEQLGRAGTALRAALGNAERRNGAGRGAKGDTQCAKRNIDHSSAEDPLLVLSDFGDRGEEFEAPGIPPGSPGIFPDCSQWKFRLNRSYSHSAHGELRGYARPDSGQKSEERNRVRNGSNSSRKRQRDEDGDGDCGGGGSGGGRRGDGRKKYGGRKRSGEHIGRDENEDSSCSSSLSSSQSSFAPHSNAWFRWKPGGYTLENDHEGESYDDVFL